MEKNNFDLFWLLGIIKKHITLLLIIFIITIVSSSLFSLYMIEDKFESSVIIYPTITNAATTSLETALEFGGEGEAEQLLDVLGSDEIRYKVIEKYNLFDRYEIEDDNPYPKTAIKKAYEKHIKFKKTRFHSIRVVVLDKDPQIAADIANDFLDLIDMAMTRIRATRADQSIEILERRKEILTQQKNIAQDSLKKYHALGMIKVGQQTERLTEQYAIALAANNISGARRIKNELNLFAENVGDMEYILRKTWKIEDELSAISIAVDKIRLDAEYTYNNTFVINRATPADKKSYPQRSLIVMSSLISVMSMALISLIVFESGILHYVKN
ncbi:MAG: hypothetical protein CMP65_04955 [Flavobacteriales bacterium]|nr:hypothetical protein [Flavobacteriales bacterium]|tara:strand:- start:2729 stop:3712 length:984 start_codon:yes stop_codon:yes gene_type:complete